MDKNPTVAVQLPDAPLGKEFEEFLLAYFQSCGLYTERNIEEKSVLEIDMVVTECKKDSTENRLVEAKSGGYGMGDIFKVKGQMEYLKIRNGIFIVKDISNPIHFAKHKQISRDLGIELIQADLQDENIPFESAFLSPKKINSTDFSSWRFAYWIERNMLEKLVHKSKSVTGCHRFRVLRDYLEEINKDIFYSSNKASRVLGLYNSFQRFPRLSARCGNEIEGRDFDAAVTGLSKDLFATTIYNCEYNDIQISMFLEQKGRIAILKNLVDYNSSEKIEIFGMQVSAQGLLPTTFSTACDIFRNDHEFFYLYPIFWQWFSWVFGGFILNDYINEEYQLLSDKTGIPVSEIPKALQAFDILFPTDRGWFTEPANANYKVLNMFPAPFKGMGAHFRAKHYGGGDFRKMKLTGAYTHTDLAKWNNAAVNVLNSN
jgi:hypothetical protein